MAGVEELADRHKKQTIAVASHADTIRVILSHYLGTPLDLVHRLEVRPASISIVDLFPSGGVRVPVVNQVAGCGDVAMSLIVERFAGGAIGEPGSQSLPLGVRCRGRSGELSHRKTPGGCPRRGGAGPAAGTQHDRDRALRRDRRSSRGDADGFSCWRFQLILDDTSEAVNLLVHSTDEADEHVDYRISLHSSMRSPEKRLLLWPGAVPHVLAAGWRWIPKVTIVPVRTATFARIDREVTRAMTITWRPEIVDVVGRFVDASNATLLATTAEGDKVVYKPTAGERPLWDFTVESLAVREVLTYEVAVAMGYDIVPETVLGDGPYGPGAIQRFVEIVEDFDPVAAVESGLPSLWPIAVLDLVTNNADRKLGHLISDGRRLLGIDHGLTFHAEDKLRTVLWQFSGVPLPDSEQAALRKLALAVEGGLGARVEDLLGVEERTALAARVDELVATPVHPHPPVDRPPLPWPPY